MKSVACMLVSFFAGSVALNAASEQIHLKWGVIDTSGGTSETLGDQPTAASAHIVQHQGKIEAAWRQAVKKTGLPLDFPPSDVLLLKSREFGSHGFRCVPLEQPDLVAFFTLLRFFVGFRFLSRFLTGQLQGLIDQLLRVLCVALLNQRGELFHQLLDL